MLKAYLQELGRELARTLPPEDVRARLAEAEAHLREGLEGRLELGMEPHEAERETVVAFGVARRVGQAERTVARTPPSFARFRSLVAAFAVAYGTVALGNPGVLGGFLFDAFLTVAALCAVVFAVGSFRARRPAPWTTLRIGLVALAGFWLLCGAVFLDSSVYGGSQGLVPRLRASRMIETMRVRIAENEAARPVFEAGWAKAEGDVEGLRTPSGYRAPFVFPPPASYGSVPTAREARHRWRYAHDRAGAIFGTRGLQRDVDSIERAQAAPFRNLLSMTVLLPGALFLAAYGVALDLASGGLGLLALALRRRKGNLYA